MLPSGNQLKKEKDFDLVFKKGKSFKESSLLLKIKKNKLKESRFGFVVSKKVSLKSVVRNKIKRRLREIVKEELPNIKKGLDCVLLAFPGLKEEDPKEVREDTKKLLKKAGVIK